MNSKQFLVKTLIGLPINALFVMLAVAIGTIDWAFVLGMASALSLFVVNLQVNRYWIRYKIKAMNMANWTVTIDDCDPQTLNDWEHFDRLRGKR